MRKKSVDIREPGVNENGSMETLVLFPGANYSHRSGNILPEYKTPPQDLGSQCKEACCVLRQSPQRRMHTEGDNPGVKKEAIESLTHEKAHVSPARTTCGPEPDAPGPRQPLRHPQSPYGSVTWKRDD